MVKIHMLCMLYMLRDVFTLTVVLDTSHNGLGQRIEVWTGAVLNQASESSDVTTNSQKFT